MAFDDNMNIRSAYMQIITAVLEKGAQFESLSSTINVERYERLVDVMYILMTLIF